MSVFFKKLRSLYIFSAFYCNKMEKKLKYKINNKIKDNKNLKFKQ